MTSNALSPFEQEQQAKGRVWTPTQVAAKIVWFIALVVMAFFAWLGYMNFELAESAPQQAAAAAWACFQIVVPYVLARAVSEILTI